MQVKRALVTLCLVTIFFASVTGATTASEPGSTQRDDLQAAAEWRGISYEQELENDARRNALDPMLDALLSDQGFGGFYSEQLQDGSLAFHLQYTLESTHQRAVGLQPNVDIQYELVDHSFADIKKAQTEISDNYTGVTETRSLDVENNLEIGFENEASQAIETIRATYWPEIEYAIAPGGAHPVSCNATSDLWDESRLNCFDQRGAVEIQTESGNSHHNRCSMNLWATGQTNPDNQFIITAAHCGTPTDDTESYWHNGTYLGDSTKSSATLSNPGSDSRKIKVIAALQTALQGNRLYWGAGDPSHAVTSVDAIIFNGDDICKGGVGGTGETVHTFFGTWCGDVVNNTTSWTLPGTNKTIFGYGADFAPTVTGPGVNPGDSGAVVFWQSKLIGLAASTNNANTYTNVSPSNSIANDLNINWCFSADCT